MIINYAMDEYHPVFPHQIKIVRELSRYFEDVYVITNAYKVPKVALPKHIYVCNLNWKPRQPVSNLLKLLIEFIKLIKVRRVDIVFSHMTEVHSAILAPFTKLLAIPHILWYAHKSLSKWLLWNSLFIDKIITSTRDSCPLKSKKVVAIGQSVDETVFKFTTNRNYAKKSKWVHVGRIDPSKKIHTLIKLFLSQTKVGSRALLDFVGESTPNNLDYSRSLFKLRGDYPDQINFLGKKNQKEVNEILEKSDLFIHAFQGSLDKSLVEAVMNGISVVSCNHEFIKEFGSLSAPNLNATDEDLLLEEIAHFMSMSAQELAEIAAKRYEVAITRHSLSSWMRKLILELDYK